MHVDLINKLDTVDYDQTHDLLYAYTSDTPPVHHCGVKSQSVEEVNEQKRTVVGGEGGAYGKGTIMALTRRQ